ncbi:hypothetical protein [Sphingobacterium mizutaii]|uniref:hypothetical protein n=1 Tax=Sphingobacterium mizutaii TaxID=1010 RepID=UPI0028971258|nr:hypothetical protein [Sphingobacterium mizutaii]
MALNRSFNLHHVTALSIHLPELELNTPSQPIPGKLHNKTFIQGISIKPTQTHLKPIPAHTQTVRGMDRGQSQFPFVSVLGKASYMACVGVLCVLEVEMGQNVLSGLEGLKKG